MFLRVLDRLIRLAFQGSEEALYNHISPFRSGEDYSCPNNGRIKKTHWGVVGHGKGDTGAHLIGDVSYDFDFVEVTKTPLSADLGKYFKHDGRFFEARWRSPRTIMSLTMSPPIAQELLAEAGFGYDFSGEKIPSGRFRPEEAEMRHAVIGRLSNILLERQDDEIDWGHFSPNALMAAHAEALPYRPDAEDFEFMPQGNGRLLMVMAVIVAICLGIYAALSMTDMTFDAVAFIDRMPLSRP